MPKPAEGDHDPWRSRVKWTFAVFAIIGAFFLIAEHRAHVIPFLPWLILAACPLMHLFMHRGHGGHGAHAGHDDGRGSTRAAPARNEDRAGESHVADGRQP